MNRFKNMFHRTTMLTKVRTCMKWTYRPLENLCKPFHIPFRPSKKNEVHLKMMNNIMKHFYHRKELVINDFENMSFFNFKSAQDKKDLSGMVYEPNKDSKKWVIATHWFGGHKWWALFAAIPFIKMGYNVMCFDFRGHGDSQWDTCTMGNKESRDLLGALEWLKQNRDYDELALMGTSMGAYVVSNIGVQYADQIQKYNIKYAVCDAPFASIENLFIRERNIYLKFIPKSCTKKVVRRLIDKENKFEKKYKCNLDKGNTFDWLAKGNKPLFPILFNHSKNDLVTPFTDTYELYATRKDLIKGDKLNMYNYCMHTQALRVHFKTFTNLVTSYIAEQNNNQEQYNSLVKEWKLNKVVDHKDRKDQRLK